MKRVVVAASITGTALLAACSPATGTASPPASTAPATRSPVPASTAAATTAPPASPSATPPVPSSAPATASASGSAVPVLGQSRQETVPGHGPQDITKGYGTARPATISNGGDPTGLVTGVTWSSWGGPKAVGSGLSYYDPPNQPVARSVQEKATVVAFGLTTCHGTYMYEDVEWYFPESGGTFSSTQYLDACTWTFRGQ